MKCKPVLWCYPVMDGDVGHTAWAAEGREGQSQAGPKGRQLEVGPRRGPRLLVYIYIHWYKLDWREQELPARFSSCQGAAIKNWPIINS